jgi:hypothetical protein
MGAVTSIPGPFARPDPSLRIREGAPPLQRPTKEEVGGFPAEARTLLQGTASEQERVLASPEFDLAWMEGRHLLFAGATGPGIGAAMAIAALKHARPASITVVARDLRRSLGFETGQLMAAEAEAAANGTAFRWLNDGMGLEGEALETILATLRDAGARRVVYVNTVAAASSGLLPGMPPVYAKDRDEQGLFQWQLTPLGEREIEATSFVMGEMAVRFAQVLEANGIDVEAGVFADWRGSLDRISRDPERPEYGRQGAYSTSLYLPKDIIQEAVREAYGSGKVWLDIFYPMMRTRALPFIPGAVLTADVNATLMRKEGITQRNVPELGVMALDRIGRSLQDRSYNPFPRLDDHDAHLDEWLYEIMARLTNDEDSDFYYERWVDG